MTDSKHLKNEIQNRVQNALAGYYGSRIDAAVLAQVKSHVQSILFVYGEPLARVTVSNQYNSLHVDIDAPPSSPIWSQDIKNLYQRSLEELRRSYFASEDLVICYTEEDLREAGHLFPNENIWPLY
jgi:hypothetical protein